MIFEPLASDFYGFESLLTAPEQEAIARLRAWAETEAKPIVNEYWERAEFPKHLITPLLELDVARWAWPETTP